MKAWREYEAHFPQRLIGWERAWALGRYADGRPVRRAEIQGWLELAAVALDTDPARMGSHSLRIGGATAMYHANNGDLARVRRFGRWTSDAFHLYLWDSHEQARTLAKGMAEDTSELVARREGGRAVSW